MHYVIAFTTIDTRGALFQIVKKKSACDVLWVRNVFNFTEYLFITPLKLHEYSDLSSMNGCVAWIGHCCQVMVDICQCFAIESFASGKTVLFVRVAAGSSLQVIWETVFTGSHTARGILSFQRAFDWTTICVQDDVITEMRLQYTLLKVH